jgi:hypothetical protein
MRRRVKDIFGILGFIRFLKGYYMILITDCNIVAKIGRHEIFTVKGTDMISLFNFAYDYNDDMEDEKKYVSIFKTLDLNKCFYFSYTYNITIRLQEAIMKKLKNKDGPSNDAFKKKVSPTVLTKSSSDVVNAAAFTSFRDKLTETPGSDGKKESFQAETYFPWNENFLWNYTLIKEFFSVVQDKRWVMPVIHGYVN